MAARKTSKTTKTSKRYGSTTPRIFTPPLAKGPPGPCGCGCALTPDTSLGYSVVQFAEEILKVELLPWQRWALIHALELRPDGTPRYRTVLILVARQNGKSTLMQVLALWVMYVLGRKMVIGTAQNLDVAEEVWQGAVEIAEETAELAAEIEQVSKVNGKKFIKLSTGERYKVAAASRRGGRGLSGDLVLLDELREHQSWDAWAAVTKTTMARALAQVWAASNAGDAASIVLAWLRTMAHTALGDPDGLLDANPDIETDTSSDDFDEDTLGIFEWSTEPGTSIWDRDGWSQSNPALGYTITEQAIAAAARTDPEWVFRIEVLCQWMDGTIEGPFPSDAWETCADPPDGTYPGSVPADDSDLCWGLDVSWDRSTTHIGLGGWRDDGTPHLELVASRTGTDWMIDWFTDPRHPHRAEIPIVAQGKKAPVSPHLADLEEAGLTVIRWEGDDLTSGTADFYDRVRSAVGEEATGPGLRHRAQPILDGAAANAATRPVGDNWLWDRRRSPVDIAPLIAINAACWALTTRRPPPAPRIRRLGGARA